MSRSVTLGDLRAGVRLGRRLPGFLRDRVTVEEAHAVLRQRLEHRQQDFLALVRRGIYGHPPSPYRALLRLAGCEYGDLERLVGLEGVEGALRVLLRHGVYLSLDELKGRRPVVRGAATLEVRPEGLLNPAATIHVLGETGGSRGARAPVPLDLAFVREWAVPVSLDLAARGGLAWTLGLWYVPGAAGIATALTHLAGGLRPHRWFTPIDPRAESVHPRYRWSVRLLRGAATLAGVSFPGLDRASLEDPGPVLRWVGEVRAAGGTPYLVAYASSAARLCQAATERGVPLDGLRVLAVGEPLTSARLAAARRAGAVMIPNYGSMDAAFVGHGCLAPVAPDEIHVFADLHAIVQPAPDGAPPGMPGTALLFSSIRPRTPLVLLNASLGDQAVASARACGCPLERLGWTTHLHAIRSFEKLTAGGMTFLDADVIRILEEALPGRFGGGPGHYQVVEEEGCDGRPRLRLLVHPALGPLDADVVARAFLDAIGDGSGAERVMGLAWRDAGFLRVERQPPLATAAGKILHIHAGAPRPPDAPAGTAPPGLSRPAPGSRD